MTKALQELVNTKGLDGDGFGLSREPAGETGAVITVTGELDMLTVPELRAALDGALAEDRSIALDLLDVTFIDSVSLAAIVNTRRRQGEHGRLVVAVAPDSYSMLIFEIGGLESIVEIVHTRQEALARIAS